MYSIQVERVSLDPVKKPVSGVPSESSASSTRTAEDARQPANVKLETNASAGAVARATKKMNIVRSSKFRHIEGHLCERSSFITKFPSLSSTVPGDSNAFQVSDVKPLKVPYLSYL